MDIADAARAAMYGAEKARELEAKTRGFIDARGGLSSPEAIYKWGQDALAHIQEVRPGILDEILKPRTMENAIQYLKPHNAANARSSDIAKQKFIADIPHDPQEFYDAVHSIPDNRNVGYEPYLTSPMDYQMYMNRVLTEQLNKLQGYSTVRNATREDLHPLLNKLVDTSGTYGVHYPTIQSHLEVMKNMTPEQQSIYMILLEANPDINIAEPADMARNI